MDCGPPGSSVHGFSRQEYWGELPFPPPGDLPHPGIEPGSPALVAGRVHVKNASLCVFYGDSFSREIWELSLGLAGERIRTGNPRVMSANFSLT